MKNITTILRGFEHSWFVLLEIKTLTTPPRRHERLSWIADTIVIFFNVARCDKLNLVLLANPDATLVLCCKFDSFTCAFDFDYWCYPDKPFNSDWPGGTSPNPRHLAVGWLTGLRVRECVLCTYSYAGGRLADWLAPLRVRAYVRCRCRFTKVKRFSC